MEVIVLESEVFKRLEEMYADAMETIKQQASLLTKQKIGLITARQVGEITGYNEKTIRLHKEDIGYVTMGKDVKFKPSDVQAWINRYYRGPRMANGIRRVPKRYF